MSTSKEIVMAAVNHRSLERTAVTFDAEGVVYDALYKRLGLKTRQELFDYLHCDTWMVFPKLLISEEKKQRKENLWGWRTTTAKYEGGTYEELTWSPLAGKDELSDIDAHAFPDPSLQDYGHFAAEIPAHKDRAILGACCWGAYFTASFLRGMEGIMMDLALNQPYAEKLIGRISEIIQAMLLKMLSTPGAEGIDIVYMADDTCNHRAPMFSPALYRRFVMPYLSKMTGIAHKYGKKFLLHTCGAVRPVLPMIIESGVDMLEPIQITAEGMEPAGLKRDFGKDICFYGGLDLQHVLNQGTPASVAAEVRRLIDLLGKDGGYVFGPGHTYIQVDAPLDNILSMYKAAYEHRPWAVGRKA
jgi:uroporphyrinogen decarboxylase